MAQELEMKILTDPEEFRRCLKKMEEYTGGEGDCYVQTNSYFDSPNTSLDRAHAMLRVRRKKGNLYLQYKNKRSRKGALLICDEQEAVLEFFPKTVNPFRYFPSAPDLECVYLGDMQTRRTDFSVEGAVVSFDENSYLGKTDYEIEIEGDPHSIEAVANLLGPKGESKKGDGKFARFMKEYEDGRGENS